MPKGKVPDSESQNEPLPVARDPSADSEEADRLARPLRTGLDELDLFARVPPGRRLLRTVPPPSPVPATPREAVVLQQYDSLVTVLVNIFNEFWQTNAFFTAFATVIMGALVSNWNDFLRAPYWLVVGTATVYSFMMVVWSLTLLRHRQYIAIHMAHLRDIEEAVPGLSMYHRRKAEIAKRRSVSVKRLWQLIPLVALLVMLGMLVVRIQADLDRETSTPIPPTGVSTPVGSLPLHSWRGESR